MSVREIIERFGITQQQLADFTGIPRDRIGKWVQQNRMPPKATDLNAINAFVNYFTQNTFSNLKDIVDNYYYDGSGVKIRSELEPKAGAEKTVIPLGKHAHTRLKTSEYKDAFSEWGGLPMYNLPITASFIASYRDEQGIMPQYYLYDPRFRDCDFGAIITGDSMHSEIRHGDFIACKEITDMSFVVYGDIYYVVGKNGLETCKYLNADPDDKDSFLLVPRNEKISPSPIKKDMVLKMYKVRGIIRGY